MAKLVQKSGYIQSDKAGGYMKYIATREGVEKLSGNGPVTKGQRELIQKLLHDFPDAAELFEYEDYCKTPTLGYAVHCYPPSCAEARKPWPVQFCHCCRSHLGNVGTGSA